MRMFKELYESIELHFFNSLTKKLSSLFLLVAVSGGLYWHALNTRTDLLAQLSGASLDAATLHQIEGSLNGLGNAILFSTLFTLVMISFMVWYFRPLIVRPVTLMTHALED